MPLGTEVGLGSGNIVLDGTQLPPKGAQPPIFGPCLLWQNSWMNQDATPYVSIGLGPADIVLDGGQPQRGTPPNFRSISAVANGLQSQLMRSSSMKLLGLSWVVGFGAVVFVQSKRTPPSELPL